jgi:tRNA (Thr-GGU) A37 N-methylase
MNEETQICSECGRKSDMQRLAIIDDKPVCFICLYGDTKPVEVYPIGTVRTKLRGEEMRRPPGELKNTSCVQLFPSQGRFLYKLEEEASLLVVYHLHKVKSVSTTFHRRLDGKKVGVFAARTPYRLSKIAVQEVRLIRIDGTNIYVEGLDAIDGSPVLDIKLGLSHYKEHGE